MILEDQPAWNTHIRSSHTLRNSSKRHFTGFLFESMVIHDLRVYGQDNDAKVYHYRDSSGLEVDGIVLLVWLTLTNALRLNH
jgi:hypothetical protein